MNLLKSSLCSKNNINIFQKDKFRIEMAESILDLEEAWSMAAPEDIFFSIAFLKCVEQNPPSGIKPYYAVVFENENAVGIVYLQLKYVKLKENLRADTLTSRKVVKKATYSFKKIVVEKINFHTIICGNLMLTGKYGYHFNNEIPINDHFKLVQSVTDHLYNDLKTINISPGLVLIKDMFSKQLPDQISDFDFTSFSVQPKMILHLKKSWNSFDDYLNDMKSKYRVRARKAFQKSENIIKREFDSDDINKYQGEIMTLYRNIADEAGFNAFILHDNYFSALKLSLGDNMKFITYWKENKIVAFFTSIINYDVLDAHFLGYDQDENFNSQLYLNMLYDLVREGIKQKVDHIDMSRTAVEIKSTVGAVPHEMHLFLKHSNPVLNKIVKPILGFVKPNDKFVIRSPFRDE